MFTESKSFFDAQTSHGGKAGAINQTQISPVGGEQGVGGLPVKGIIDPFQLQDGKNVS